jgi:hypothetical protein
VCAAVQALPEVGKVDYDANQNLFSLEYEQGRLRLEDIFAAVVLAGKKMGREYWPRLLGEPA